MSPAVLFGYRLKAPEVQYNGGVGPNRCKLGLNNFPTQLQILSDNTGMQAVTLLWSTTETRLIQSGQQRRAGLRA